MSNVNHTNYQEKLARVSSGIADVAKWLEHMVSSHFYVFFLHNMDRRSMVFSTLDNLLDLLSFLLTRNPRIRIGIPELQHFPLLFVSVLGKSNFS